MKKKLLIVIMLAMLTSCTTMGSFWDSFFGKEKYQPIPSNKRTPILNNSSVGLPPQIPGQPPIIPPAGMMPTIPEAPDPFASAPLPPQYAPEILQPVPQPYIPSTQLPPVVGEGRRAPEFNRMAEIQIPVPVPVDQAGNPVTGKLRLPELPDMPPAPQYTQAPQVPQLPPQYIPPSLPPRQQLAAQMALDESGYPKLANVPPQQNAPTPLKDDPRVRELQNNLAESKYAQGYAQPPLSPEQLAMPPRQLMVPPPPPLDWDDQPMPIQTPQVTRQEMPGNINMPPVLAVRRPAEQQAIYNPAYNPAQNNDFGKPSTDYRNIRRVASSGANVEYSYNAEGEKLTPNKVDILQTGHYDKLRQIRSRQANASGGLARHSSID